MINQHEGYLLIDHRASPGVPDAIAVKTGFDPKQLREGKILESATTKCAHCLCVVIKHPMRIRERAFCQKCNQYICDWCDAERCKPDYKHASGEARSDTIINSAINGVNLGSPMDLLSTPKIVVP